MLQACWDVVEHHNISGEISQHLGDLTKNFGRNNSAFGRVDHKRQLKRGLNCSQKRKCQKKTYH